MELEQIGQEMNAVKELVSWVSGITGLSSLVVLAIGLFVGSKIIKGIIKLLIGIALVAAAVFFWAQLG